MNIELLYTGLLTTALYLMVIAACVLFTMLMISFFGPVGDEAEEAERIAACYRKPGWW
jgi:hypothetical protein